MNTANSGIIMMLDLSNDKRLILPKSSINKEFWSPEFDPDETNIYRTIHYHEHPEYYVISIMLFNADIQKWRPNHLNKNWVIFRDGELTYTFMPFGWQELESEKW